MATNQQEYCGFLFDQLTILERIEEALNSGGKEAAQKKIETIRKEVNRKLYQYPPLGENER